MTCFEEQIKYNTKKANRLLSDVLFRRTVESMGVKALNDMSDEEISKVVDKCLAKMGMFRSTSLERACVVYQISRLTGEEAECKLCSGYCLNKDSQYYNKDKSFYEKKRSTGRSHVAVPNFSYCTLKGVSIGIKESKDYIDTIELQIKEAK